MQYPLMPANIYREHYKAGMWTYEHILKLYLANIVEH